MVYTSHSHQETWQKGYEFAKTLQGGDVLALYGDLGSGKTTFTQGLMQGLCIKRRIISPTFTMVRTYKVPDSSVFETVYHIDLYRTRSENDIQLLGIDEFMGGAKTLTIIEWAEKMEKLLPQNRWDMHFLYNSDTTRTIEIEKK